MSKGQGAMENDAVRKRTLRSLVLYSTPNWWLRAFAIVSFSVALYSGISGAFKHWGIYFVAAGFGLAIPYTFMRSLLEIDYDKDIIEIKLWKVWSFVRQSRQGLANATRIQIDVDAGGDSTMVTKFLVFSDGQEIELPETREIGNILSGWYEHYFHRQLPVLKNKLNYKGQRV